MHTIDFSPLFRHSVGFDRLQHLADAALQSDNDTKSYPPYNIEQVGECGYRISMAVAGFSEADLDVTSKENTLVVSGNQPEGEDVTYLHRGIAGRAFERRFELAEHIKVSGANLVNGMLQIELVCEIPEEKKPRSVAIHTKPVPHKDAA